MSASVLKPEEVQQLVRLMAKTPARHRYVLVQRAPGELGLRSRRNRRNGRTGLDPPRHKGTPDLLNRS
jgi:hypothetical protein